MNVKTERDGDVFFLTLNRPEHGNRLDQATIEDLTRIFSAVDPLRGGAAVVVLAAAGPDFSLGRQRPAEQSDDPLEIVAEFEQIQRLNEAIQRCRAVTIAAIHGRAEGAGLSLAGRCDIVIVADDARLSFPEIPHGIPPTIVLSHYRYVLPRNLLGDLIFTGRELRGREAVEAGLATRVAPADDVQELAASLARQIARYDRRSVALVKSFMARSEGLPPGYAPSLGISLYANEMSHRFLKSKGN
jgi:enoyl-CoA hydratase/carnithine racemase